MTKPRLDDFDRKILEHLSLDARVSNRKIASALGVTEGTVRSRIKRLQESNVISITAVTDASLMGAPVMAYIGIDVIHSQIPFVADKIAQLDDIRFIAVMLGRYNILAITLISETEQLVDLVNSQIVPLEGVRHVQTALSLKAVKYDYRWGRILL